MQWRGLLVAVILLAAVVRFYGLEEQSLWYDEGFSIALARLPWSQAIAWTAQDVHPPLYYLFLHLWIRLAGDGAFAVRAFSVWFGIASVPLIAVLGRRVLGKAVGWMAALLATLSPLYIYYARETRMYALLTFLTLLSSYLVLRITTRQGMERGRAALWAAYVCTALALAYVHYFALFVLVAQAVYFGAWWLREGRPRQYGMQAAAASSLWLLGYAPWLPILLGRYLYDTGYWQGSLPFLTALGRIFISFSSGEMIQVPGAWYVALGYLGLLAVSASAFLRSYKSEASRSVPPALYLWVYLLLPALAIAFLYSRRPKVTPRYSMLVSPAFLLLSVAAIASLWRGTRRWLHFLALAAACFVLVTASYADHNLFFAPAMRKPDFRGAVRYVCQECAPDEVILLVSGHMFPIFDYYCPGHERYPIPNDVVLRVDNRVTLDVLETLQPILAGKRGVWLMLWQDDVVDPRHIVPGLVLSQGRELPVAQSFHGVGVRHIQLAADARFTWESTLTFPGDWHWLGGITLLEARINRREFRLGDGLQLTLYWRAERPVTRSYTVFAHVEWKGMRTQHDGLPVDDTRPTNTWRPGEIIEDRHWIQIPFWMEAGEYEVRVGLYDYNAPGMPRLPVVDQAGQVIADYVVLGSVHLLPGIP